MLKCLNILCWRGGRLRVELIIAAVTILFISHAHGDDQIKVPLENQQSARARSFRALESVDNSAANFSAGIAAAGFPSQVNVKDLGAIGDGLSDDTAAIQAAIDSLPANGGALFLPVGNYKITSTLNLSRTGSPFKVQFQGNTASSTVIHWAGSIDGTAIRARFLKRFKIANIGLKNDGPRGMTTGFHLTAEAAVGSDTGPGIVENVEIQGFHEGWAVGDSAGRAASEILYLNLLVALSDTCVVLRGDNSLNHQFHNLSFNGCGTGLEAINPDSVFVYGGSASHSAVQDFAFRQSGEFGIFGFRSETANRFVTFGPDEGGGPRSPTVATIQGVKINRTLAPDGRAIRLNKMGQYNFSGNSVRGHIYLGSGGGKSSLSLVGNTLEDKTLIESANGDREWVVTTRGNTNSLTRGGDYWPDEYYVLARDGEKAAVAWTTVETGSTVYGAPNAPVIIAGQLLARSGTPTILNGACGPAKNGVISSGTNQTGLITIGPAATSTCTISFSMPLPHPPNACVIFPANSAANTRAHVSFISAKQWVISGPDLANTAYYYICI